MNFSQLTPADVFGIRYLPEDHKLLGVLDHMWRVARREGPPARTHYWEASHFGLEGVSAYRDLGPEKQQQVLDGLSQFYLCESFFIERGGFTYNAKMMSLVESVEEKSLYAMFAADEANHLRYFANALSVAPTEAYLRNPLLLFLAQVLAQADKRSAVFVVQVMLEGFGLAHYHRLAEGCIDPVLKEQLERIVRDEAFHHGSGMVLTKREPVDVELGRAFIAKMVEMLNDWPHAILGVLELAHGGLTEAQKLKVLTELDYPTQTADRLQKVRSLIVQAAPDALLPALEASGAFRQYTAIECVRHLPADLVRVG